MNWRRLLKPILLVLLLAITISALVLYRGKLDTQLVQSYVQDHGIFGPIIFIALYSFVTIVFLPGSIMTIAGGFIFGPVWGTVYNLTGAVIGSSLAFLIARYIAADWVAKRSGGFLEKLLRGVAREGWKFVAAVRLIPLIPFNLLNYSLGITQIRFSHSVITSAICMLPGTFAYTYVGSLGQTALAGEMKTLFTRGLVAIGLLVLVAAVPYFIKRMRNMP